MSSSCKSELTLGTSLCVCVRVHVLSCSVVLYPMLRSHSTSYPRVSTRSHWPTEIVKYSVVGLNHGTDKYKYLSYNAYLKMFH